MHAYAPVSDLESFVKFCICQKSANISAIFNENIEIRESMRTVERSALCRSRRELSNEYFLAKIGVDTAENEPLEVWGKIQLNIKF